MNGLLITAIVLIVTTLIINLILLVQVRKTIEIEQMNTETIIRFALKECIICKYKDKYYTERNEKGKTNA